MRLMPKFPRTLQLYPNAVTSIVRDSVKVESSHTSRNPLALRSSYHGDLEPWLDLYSIVYQLDPDIITNPTHDSVRHDHSKSSIQRGFSVEEQAGFRDFGILEEHTRSSHTGRTELFFWVKRMVCFARAHE